MLEGLDGPHVATVIRHTFAKLRDAGCTLVEIDFNGEVRNACHDPCEYADSLVIAMLVPPLLAQEGTARTLSSSGQ